MGEKYIIELNDNCNSKFKGIIAFGLTQEEKISVELIPKEIMKSYTEPDLETVRKEAYEKGYHAGYVKYLNKSYEDGLKDIWDAVRKIGGMTLEEQGKIFNTVTLRDIVSKFTASEAIDKLKAYEQEQEEFHVGDEFENETGKKFVVLKVNGKEIDRYMDSDGQTYHMDVKYRVMRKTGRYFPEVTTILEKMRGENDD